MPADFRGAISDQPVDQRDVSVQLAALDNIRTRRVARHEDARFETGASGIRGQRATGIASAGNCEAGCAEMFCHRNGHAHSARLKTLRWIERLIFDPEIDIVSKSLCA